MTKRVRRDWPFVADVLVADVLAIESESLRADVVVSSFGLKTFSAEQQERLAHKVAQILKPGGSYSFVEISVPPSRLLRPIYMFYLKRVIPLIGRLMLGDPSCYRMLGVYTEAFGNAHHFATYLRAAGLEARETSLFFGCATGVRGIKPAV
jgi:demethylmenaquinone methyltransferase/2-methoxy-6-polyprenyl-1,4-benzoquinol methylase